MKQSESVKGLLESLVKAQAEFTTLPKDKSGYGYKYTDLDTVITYVRPVLARYSLGFLQSLTTIDGGKNAITTRLFSSTGEYLEDTIALPDVQVGKTNAAQNMGAAITYMKRYALCAVLGISSDEDVDAAEPHKEQSAPRVQTKPNTKPQEQKPQQQASANNSKSYKPAGGVDTKEQFENIKNLLKTVDKNGALIFPASFASSINEMRRTKTADEVIAYLRAEVKRVYDAQSNRPEQTPQPAQPSFDDVASAGFNAAENVNADDAIF